MAVPANLAVLACLFAISFSGGLYIVPLYAAIQYLTPEDRMAGVIACSNVTDSLFMVGDVEIQEGMIWEAAMSAFHYTAFVGYEIYAGTNQTRRARI